MHYEPLHHKYRPQTFGDLVGQEAIATTLTNAIGQQRIAPAYLFTGPRGTGKTSSARIFAKSLNCIASNVPTAKPCGKCNVCQEIARGSSLDVIEIDAASNTGVDNIRELIEKAQFAPVQCRYKVYIIDEVHMLSVAAFNALLKTLEEPPKYVIFVLATTDPQRVLATIISRCQRFDFRRIPLNSMVKHLREIATKENIDITDESLTLLAQLAQGGMRDAESTLDQLSLLAGQVTVERVWDLVGAVPEKDLMALLEAISQNNAENLLDRTRRLMERGREPLIVLQNLAGFYRDLLIAKTAHNRNDLVALTAPTWIELCHIAKNFDIPIILAGQKHLKESEYQIKNTTQPRLWLEVTLLGLLPLANSIQRVELQPNLTQIQQQQQRAIAPLPPNNYSPPISQPKPQPSSPISPVNPEPITSIYDPVVVNSIAEIPSSGEKIDLEQIWHQIILNIQPNSAKELLRQHSRLLAFDANSACVGVNSHPLLQIALPKLPNIEAAFRAVFNREIKVKLEVPNSHQSKSSNGTNKRQNSYNNKEMRNNETKPKENITSTLTNSQPVSSPTINQSASTYSATTFHEQQPIQSQIQSQKSEITKSHFTPETIAPSIPPYLPQVPIQNLKVSDSEIDNSRVKNEEKAVTDAALRLVDFFQGEIVDFTPEFELILSSPKQEKQESKNLNLLNLQNWEPDGLEDEEEDF